MGAERTRVGVAVERPIDFVVATEECPWCGSQISRTKFLEIETRIRTEEQKKLEAERTKLEVAMRLQLQNETLKIRQDARNEAEKLLQATAVEKSKALRVRDQALQQLKEREAAVKKQAHEESEQKLKIELAKIRTALENDRDQALMKLESKFARERDDWATRMKQLQLKFQQQRSNELGEGAEIEVYDALREVFPADKITRIKKGESGADIRHEIFHKGDLCGTILYDSKNRQIWKDAFAQKLHADQIAAKANHAILTTTAFPSGKKELCVVADVIAINPARVTSLVELLRTWLIRLHILGLSVQKRKDKTAKLYEFITSETFNRQSEEIVRLTENILDMDVEEKKQHDKTWSKRGALLTRLQRVHGEMTTNVAAILEGVDV